MDEVHAWDQPDLYFYVFAWADLYDHPVDLFQTTLGGGEELDDAVGGVGGGVAALAEDLVELVVVGG